MSQTSMILSGLILIALVIFVSPSIFAMNRGRVLRNVALWLALFLGLALFYKAFGPDSPRPLFKLPDAMSGMRESTKPSSETPATTLGNKGDDKNNVDSGETGFTPPKE